MIIKLPVRTIDSAAIPSFVEFTDEAIDAVADRIIWRMNQHHTMVVPGAVSVHTKQDLDQPLTGRTAPVYDTPSGREPG